MLGIFFFPSSLNNKIGYSFVRQTREDQVEEEEDGKKIPKKK